MPSEQSEVDSSIDVDRADEDIPLERNERRNTDHAMAGVTAFDADNEVDLRDDDNQTEYAPGVPAASHSNARPAGVREYWNELLAGQQAVDQRARSLATGATSLGIAPAPSTGSSTLVEHDHAQYIHPTKRVSPPAYLHDRPSSAPPIPTQSTPSRVERQSQTRRRSPLHEHIARFASLDTSEEPSRSSKDRSSSVTPQASAISHLHQELSEHYENRDATPPSEVVSRVHDIFARHIRRASLNNASITRPLTGRPPVSINLSNGDSQTAAVLAQPRQSTQRQPRQRLRDLLAAEATTPLALAHHRQDSASSTRGSEHSITPLHVRQQQRREAARAEHKSIDTAMSRNKSPQLNSTPSYREHRRNPLPPHNESDQESQDEGPPPPLAARYVSEYLQDEAASGDEHRIPQSYTDNASSGAHLIREWQQLTERTAALRLEEHRYEEDGDGDIETDGSDGEDPHELIDEEMAEDEEDSFSPSMGEDEDHHGDVGQETADDADVHDRPARHALVTPSNDWRAENRRFAANESAARIQRRTANSETLQEQERVKQRVVPSIYTDPERAATAVLHASVNRYDSPSKSGRLTRTPPKTPHPPGHYVAETPDVTLPSPTHRTHHTASAPTLTPSTTRNTVSTPYAIDKSRLPNLPGRYVSPSPTKHTAHLQVTNSPSRNNLTPPRHPHLVNASPESRNQSNTKAITSGTGLATALARQPSFASPSRVKLRPQNRLQLESEHEASTREAPTPGSNEVIGVEEIDDNISPHRQRTASGDSVLQTLLSDLVRPLRNLLSSPAKLQKPTHASQDEVDAVSPQRGTPSRTDSRRVEAEADIFKSPQRRVCNSAHSLAKLKITG